MFGNPQAERMALEATYEDTAVVTRPEPKKGADGLARAVDTNVYTDMICALSRNRDNSAQTSAQQNIDRSMVLFAPPDKEVKAGDTITVTRFSRIPGAQTFVQKFEVVGVPLHYMTHVEIPLKAVDIA